MRTFAYIMTIGVVLASWGLVDAALGLRLDQVVKESLENNPEILAAREKWEAQRAVVPQVRWLEDLQFGISFERIPQGSYSPGAAKMRMLSISQMIPFPGKLGLKGRMAQRDVMIAKEEYETKKQAVIAQVKSAYYRLFLVHKSIEIVNEEKELLRKFEKIAETKYALGQAAQHDVLKAQVELSLLSDDLITLEEEDLPTAEARLNDILNRPPYSPLGVPEEFKIPKLEMSGKEIEEFALEHRQSLKAMEYRVEKSETAHKLAKMSYLPDFGIKFMRTEMETSMNTETTGGVMLSLNIPIWFWKKGYGVSEKRAQKRSAEASYQATKNMVIFEVQNALAKFNTSERRVNLFKTSIIPQAEQTLKAAAVAYETGKVDFLTLMNSERMLRDARLKYYKILMDHGTNLANLEKAVGARLTR